MRLLSTLLTLPLVLLLVAVGAVALSLETDPLVRHGLPLSPAEMERVKRVLQRQDPRHGAAMHSELRLSEEDLNRILSYLLASDLQGRGRVSLSPGLLRGEFTWRLKDGPGRPYLNVALDLRTVNGRSRIENLRFGKLELPVGLDGHWLAELLGTLFRRENLPLIHSQVRRLVIEPSRMTLYYAWDPRVLSQARAMAMDDAERKTVLVHYRALALRLRERPASLAGLLRDSLRLAEERAREPGRAVPENRAALAALGLYALGPGAEGLLDAGANLPALPGDWVTLQGRADLTRHFLVSAAIAAAGNSALADLMGVYKEWSDSRGGSGFSFVDLAADRAGTRFGHAATADEPSARRVLRIADTGFNDRDLLPPVQDLPENLSSRAFKDAFGDIGEPRYQRMLDTIERRLDPLPFYRRESS